MYKEQTIAAVIPAYNEEPFIGDVIETVPSFIDRVYVIDDGSTDGTWEEIQRHARRVNETAAIEADGGVTDEPSPVVPIQHTENRGVGGAIKTGYRRALADEMDVTLVISGDGQTPPDVLKRILDPVADGRADYAKGNRLLDREGMPRVRQFGNGILSLLTKIASGYWGVMDPQNGSTAISRETLEQLDLDALYDDYGFTNDLLVRLNVQDARVADVSRRAVYADETSHIDVKRFATTVSALLLRDFLWRLREKYLVRDCHPLALMYLFGAATALVGVLSGIRSVLTRRSGGPDGASGTVLFVLGWLFMFLAMVFDREENRDHVVQLYDR